LFADVSDEHVRKLLAGANDVTLAAGESLFRHGESAERFFLVCAGLIKLFRLSPDGDEKIIELLRPGETFAEAVMFMGTRGRYPVNADAVADTRLIAFSQHTVVSLLRETPEIGFGLMASMSRRLHMLVNQIESLTLQNATYRLVAYLLEQIPADVAVAGQIQLTTPKSAIASRLAIQPETLSRILARLRQGALIETDGTLITVRDVSALRKFIQQSDTP
jgi:CRP-like cAMP-binding protein